MKRSWPQRRSSESGFALVFVLLLVLLASLAVRGQSGTARTSLRIAHNHQLSVQALAVAEAGIAHTIGLLDGAISLGDLLKNNGTGGALASLGVGVVDGENGPMRRYAHLGNAGSGDGYYVRALDNNDEVPADPDTDADDVVRLVSRGRAGTAERVVEVSITRSGGFGLFAKTRIDIVGAARIDSFDSSLGDYASTVGSSASVGSNGDIDTGGPGTTIAGNVSVTGTVSGSGNVTGTITSGTEPRSFNSVAPCGPNYSDGTGVSGTYSYSGTLSGDLTVSGSNNVSLDAGTYCFDSITLSGSATLTVSSGPVEIYLTGSSDFSGGGIVNATSAPSILKIFSSGNVLKVHGNGALSTLLYAPDAMLTITGSGDFYGAAVGDVVSLNGVTGFHVDSGEAFGGDIEILSWHESRAR